MRSNPEWVTMTASQLPVAMREKRLGAAGRLEVLLSRNENVRAGIEGKQFGGKLPEHVIGHDEKRLLAKAQPFCLHRRRPPWCMFSRPRRREPAVCWRLQDAPNRSLLVRPERYDGTGSRQGQVIAVKRPNADVIELVVVLPNQTLAALIVLPDPW